VHHIRTIFSAPVVHDRHTPIGRVDVLDKAVLQLIIKNRQKYLAAKAK
jgi:hypothetical protein